MYTGCNRRNGLYTECHRRNGLYTECHRRNGLHTGCPRRKGPNFGRVFLMLNSSKLCNLLPVTLCTYSVWILFLQQVQEFSTKRTLKS